MSLPAEWREGSVQGLRARGGFDVDVAWANGRATRASVRAHVSWPCRIQAKGKVTVTSYGQRVRVVQRDAETVEFPVTAGRSYQLVFDQAR